MNNRLARVTTIMSAGVTAESNKQLRIVLPFMVNMLYNNREIFIPRSPTTTPLVLWKSNAFFMHNSAQIIPVTGV